MDQKRPDFSGQRAFIAAKIAHGTAAAAAENATLAGALRDFDERFRRHFSFKAIQSTAKTQHLTQRQLGAASRAFDSWWLFGADEAAVAVGFNARLVSAASDFAIFGALTTISDAPPTAVDRSIASPLARLLHAIGGDDAEAKRNPPAWREFAAADFETALPPNNPPRWRVLSFNGRLPDDGGDIAVMIARPDPAALEGLAAEASTADAPNISMMRDIGITARCIGGGFEAPLSRILKLRPGEIIPIEWRGQGAALLTAGCARLAAGTLGDHNGRRAIKL